MGTAPEPSPDICGRISRYFLKLKSLGEVSLYASFAYSNYCMG
jgi:hypothetical protein